MGRIKNFFWNGRLPFSIPHINTVYPEDVMKNGLCLLILLAGLGACTGNGNTTVTVKTDSIGNELDTLGDKIGEKAEQVGDSVKARFNDIKEQVNARMDSIKHNPKDTTH